MMFGLVQIIGDILSWYFKAIKSVTRSRTAYGKSKSWQSDQSANPRTTCNIVVNNVQFLAQNDNFASCDLNISSGVMGIHFVLPVYAFYALWDSQSDGRRLFAFYEWPKTTV